MKKKMLYEIEETMNQRIAHGKVKVYCFPEDAIREKIEGYLEQGQQEESLYQFVCKRLESLRLPVFCKANGIVSETRFYEYARIDKSTWSELKKGKKIPQKKTLLKLVVALQLDEAQAKMLLSKGSNAFDLKNITDSIILAFVDIHHYDIEDVYDVIERYRAFNNYSFDNIYDTLEERQAKRKAEQAILKVNLKKDEGSK